MTMTVPLGEGDLEYAEDLVCQRKQNFRGARKRVRAGGVWSRALGVWGGV